MWGHRMTEFEISICLDKNIFLEKMERNITYYKDDYKDHVVFNGNDIKITGNRARKIQLDDALFTTQSTYYQDIVKSLLFSYFSHGEFKIIEIGMSVGEETKVVKQENLLQKFSFRFNKNIIRNADPLEVLFKNDEESEVLMKSLMYLVTSFNGDENRFDNLWKSFNVLIKKISGQGSDWDMLVGYKMYLLENEAKFINTLGFIEKTIDSNYLETCRISAMINNNHPQLDTEKKVKNFKERLLLNYNDKRICSILKEKMIVKKKRLKADTFSEIEKELDRRIAREIVDDTDVIRFLVLKYMYYLRCKYFHGEKWANKFLYANQDSDELDRMSILLEIHIGDIIQVEFNNNHNLSYLTT